MNANNILYLAELYIKKIKIADNQASKWILSFRIGKNMTQSTIERTSKDGQIIIEASLQLSVDTLALQTQRSSLTASFINQNNQIVVGGMALIPLPKIVGQSPRKLRLSQCKDRNAEVQLILRILPLQDTNQTEILNFDNTMRSSGVSSSKSIMEMNQFNRKIISPPRLFNIYEKNNKLLPPKPKSNKQLPISTQQIPLNMKDLQNQCACLRQLLKIQMKKNEQSNKLIDSLVQALEMVNQNIEIQESALDQTMLLDQCEHESSGQIYRARYENLQKELDQLKKILDKLQLQNRGLKEDLAKITLCSTKVSSRQNLNTPKKSDLSPQTIKRPQKNTDYLTQLQAMFLDKIQDYEKYKKKMKINLRFPNLDNPLIQKQFNQVSTIKYIFQKAITQCRQMIKILLKYIKQEGDEKTQNIGAKIRHKIDKSFGNLIAKKMNKDIILYEKGQLLKSLEEIWNKVS